MPNWIENKIIFEGEEKKADEIYESICTYGGIDFRTLIPQPLSIYQGSLTSDDDNDFERHTWNKWNRDHWGTKWNACNSSPLKKEGGFYSVQFQTAWSVPYPFIIAFANKFKIEFEYRFICEGHCFWGIEKWGLGDMPWDGDSPSRKYKSHNNQDELKALHIELKGWDPDEEDDI
jgi:hypothetical protein